MLADDVAEWRLLLRLLLEDDGQFVVVAEAADGAAAIAACEREQPELVLLDLAMPVMDGLEAIPEIRSRSPRTCVVVLSGFARAELEPQSLARGAHAYLEKDGDLAGMTETLLELTARSPRAASR